MSFSSVSEIYDQINGSAYEPYANMLVSAFEKAEIPVREVLDLGCGTGGICALLADKGYDMIGLDISYEMLNLARERNIGKNTLLLCQDMREFELYGTVQAVYSSFDCLNYITEYNDLKKVFALVHNYLEPGGVFVFDINTEYRYKNIFGDNSYVYESDGSFAVWRNSYSEKDRLCGFSIDMFTELEDGNYYRSGEEQTQRFYTPDEIISCAEGFELISKSGGKGFDGCAENEKEYYIFKRV